MEPLTILRAFAHSSRPFGTHRNRLTGGEIAIYYPLFSRFEWSIAKWSRGSAAVIAEKLVCIEMLRAGHTYDLLIVAHETRVERDSERPRLHSEILLRALRGHLPLDLIGKDRDLAGTIALEFFTKSGERRAMPSRFLDVTRVVTRAVNCVNCAHSHYLAA